MKITELVYDIKIDNEKNMTFKELGLQNEIVEALELRGVTEPTPIQALTIPVILSGRDIIGQAQTGTGKTFAYGLPVINNLVHDGSIGALIICPTRELANQVSIELSKAIKYRRDLTLTTIYGGESYPNQIRALKKVPDIIVGTPGRIIDHIDRGNIDLINLKALVLDEADEMLKMGFQEDLEKILAGANPDRQTLLFSATMPDFIKKIAKKYQKNPEICSVKSDQLTADKITQLGYFVYNDQKKDLLIRLLDFNKFTKAIVFANTKRMVDELTTFLMHMDYSADGLHGDLKQSDREKVMGRFRSGAIKILVATDVAARGIDIDDIDVIVNFDVPDELEVYVHRIGRTGRIDREGTSVTFFNPKQKHVLAQLTKFTSSEIAIKQAPSITEIENSNLVNLYDKIILESNSLSDEVNYFKIIDQLLATEGVDELTIIKALLSLNMENGSRKYAALREVKFTSGSRDGRGRDSRGRDGRGRNDSRSRDGRGSRDSRGRDGRGSRDNRGGDRRGRDSGRNESRNVSDRGNTPKIFAKINIGKDDSIRPISLLNFVKDEADVRKSNIGDINIKTDNSTFEIAEASYNYLRKLDGKSYKGKKIKVEKVNNL